MPTPQPDTDQLLDRTAAGDASAAQELLTRYRPRLRQMVAIHLDRRVSARVDPSDVVQEALAEAYQRLPQFAHDRTVSFYPWLRKLAWQRLVKLHRDHVTRAKRSVLREVNVALPLPEDSVMQLANQLAATGTEPGQHLVKQEMRERVRTALKQLRPADRSLLAMRYLEHMSLKEISEATETTLSAARKRHTRAIQRLQRLLSDLS